MGSFLESLNRLTPTALPCHLLVNLFGMSTCRMFASGGQPGKAGAGGKGGQGDGGGGKGGGNAGRLVEAEDQASGADRIRGRPPVATFLPCLCTTCRLFAGTCALELPCCPGLELHKWPGNTLQKCVVFTAQLVVSQLPSSCCPVTGSREH